MQVIDKGTISIRRILPANQSSITSKQLTSINVNAFHPQNFASPLNQQSYQHIQEPKLIMHNSFYWPVILKT